jgi:hypothetical protein
MSTREPIDVGPAAGGDRTVSETDRQHVITLLTAAHAEGKLSTAERDRRTGEATRAQDFDDLVPLTRDLVNLPSSPVRYTNNATAGVEQFVAIFSGVERAGQWSVRPRSFVTALFGGVKLDLSEATFESKEVTIEVFCMFGGVELRVPEGTRVDNQVIAIFGGSDHKVGLPTPDAPHVVVKGFVGFGGVEVRNPRKVRRTR